MFHSSSEAKVQLSSPKETFSHSSYDFIFSSLLLKLSLLDFILFQTCYLLLNLKIDLFFDQFCLMEN